jgi:cytidine deaminase
LELAISKHDVCPIVAEELAIGHVAAMPCGHLFTRIAIEESFKKETHKCPACRQNGAPTYV